MSKLLLNTQLIKMKNYVISETQNVCFEVCQKMFHSNFTCPSKRNKRVVEYRGLKSKHTQTFDNKYHAGYCCTCDYFVKQAVCSHIV